MLLIMIMMRGRWNCKYWKM